MWRQTDASIGGEGKLVWGAAGFFRVPELPLARRGFDALPSKQASIDGP